MKQQIAACVVGDPCHDVCFMETAMPMIDLLFQEFGDTGDFDLQNSYIGTLWCNG